MTYGLLDNCSFTREEVTINFLFKFFREIILLPFIWGSQKSKPGQFKLWNISEEEFSIYELKTQ